MCNYIYTFINFHFIVRRENKIKELKIVPISFIDEPNPQEKEEKKVSSSNTRLRLLGTVLNPIKDKKLPKRPYVIGLTGIQVFLLLF